MNNSNQIASRGAEECGVSDIIGTVLIVGMVVIAGGIASIIIFGIDLSLSDPDLLYVDIHKTNHGGNEYLEIMHRCGDPVRLMGDGNCLIQLIDPDSNYIALAYSDGGHIAWDDGIPVYVYKSGGDYSISASRPGFAVAEFGSGTWVIQLINKEEMILEFQNSIDF